MPDANASRGETTTHPALFFPVTFWISSNVAGNIMKSWTSTDIFLKLSSGSFVMVNYYEVSNLDRLFLKLTRVICN